jgi:hypothetical protein
VPCNVLTVEAYRCTQGGERIEEVDVRKALSILLGAGEVLNTLLMIGFMVDPSFLRQLRQSIEATESVIAPGPFPWTDVIMLGAPVAGALAHYAAWLFRPWAFGVPFWPFRLWRMGWFSLPAEWRPSAATRRAIDFTLIATGVAGLASVPAAVADDSMLGSVLFAANVLAAALAWRWRPWRANASAQTAPAAVRRD